MHRYNYNSSKTYIQYIMNMDISAPSINILISLPIFAFISGQI